MKNIFLLGLSVAFLGAAAPSAFAATAAPVVEPNNGFYRGPNPEWAALHANNTGKGEDHRAYHRAAEQTRLQWYREHQGQQGTVEYHRALRAFLQQRNLMHRLYHTTTRNP